MQNKVPKTPYQRLMEDNRISEETKEKLSLQKKQLNPFRLRSELDKKLGHFFNVVEGLDNLKNRQGH